VFLGFTALHDLMPASIVLLTSIVMPVGIVMLTSIVIPVSIVMRIGMDQ